MRVETFRHPCQAETLPPTLDWMEETVQQLLPEGSQVLQWAIVSSNPQTAALWVEGSYITP